MHDPKLIEAMREAEREAYAAAGWGKPLQNPEWLRHAQSVLALLCEARPDVAAVLRGEGLKQELADLIHDNTTLMDSLNAAEAARNPQ